MSPMDLAIARRCWQDSLFAFVGGLCIYLCAELVLCSKRKSPYLLLLFIGSYFMLIKESGIVMFGLCILWLLWEAVFKERSALRALLAATIGIASVIVCILILMEVTGGISIVLEIFRHVKEAMATNAYALECQTGPWYQIIEEFWMLTPIFTVSAFLGAAAVFMKTDIGSSPFSKNIDTVAVRRGILIFIISFLMRMYNENQRVFMALFRLNFYPICTSDT